MKKLSFILISIIITTFYACEKDTESPVNMGYNYFPIETANYSIYQVDSIVWDDYNQTIDTFHFVVKLLIDSSFTDNSGRLSYRWKKYLKNDSSQWVFNTNYTITKSSQRLETIEENMRYIKLIFPVVAGSNWDSEALNIDDATNAIYSDVDFATSILNINYDSCAQVIYEEEVNLIQEIVHHEIYARDVGMIYRKDIHKQNKLNFLQGYNVEYKLIEYGQE